MARVESPPAIAHLVSFISFTNKNKGTACDLSIDTCVLGVLVLAATPNQKSICDLLSAVPKIL